MDNLKQIVREVVFGYAGGSPVVRTYKLADEEHGVYAVNIIDWPKRKRPPSIVVMAHVDGEKVIIEEDNTDRPLVDALVSAGVPREQIELAYLDTVA